MRIGVIGAGAWGTGLAIRLAAQHDVTLVARDAGLVESMQSARMNARYLPSSPFPERLTLTGELSALESAQLWILATSTPGCLPTVAALRALSAKPLLWLCKGFLTCDSEPTLIHQSFAWPVPCGALSGPSFAQEVAAGLPVALTLASFDERFAHVTAEQLRDHAMRIYPSDDVVGVEIGGAVKNVLAIAAGLCDGLALGHNARAALITRGLAELTRLGLALGARAETLSGLAGMGDLVLTCTGDLSRNRRVGQRLAAGESLSHISAALGHVAEGVAAAAHLQKIFARVSVEMPICNAVAGVLAGTLKPEAALRALLTRELKGE